MLNSFFFSAKADDISVAASTPAATTAVSRFLEVRISSPHRFDDRELANRPSCLPNAATEVSRAFIPPRTRGSYGPGRQLSDQHSRLRNRNPSCQLGATRAIIMPAQ